MAMVEFREDRYFIGIWFIASEDSDWLCAAYRDKGEKQWHIAHRFRYYWRDENGQTGDPWDGKDKKSGYRYTADFDNEAKLEAVINELFSLLQMVGDIRQAEFVPLHSADCQANVERFSRCNFAHAKIMTPEEAQKAGYIDLDGRKV